MFDLYYFQGTKARVLTNDGKAFVGKALSATGWLDSGNGRFQLNVLHGDPPEGIVVLHEDEIEEIEILDAPDPVEKPLRVYRRSEIPRIADDGHAPERPPFTNEYIELLEWLGDRHTEYAHVMRKSRKDGKDADFEASDDFREFYRRLVALNAKHGIPNAYVNVPEDLDLEKSA
jgi:hypothetical protein